MLTTSVTAAPTLSPGHTSKGFTLIELMITIAIIALLAAVGVPAYTQQVNKAYRSDAQAALMQLASALERHRTINNTYSGVADASGIPLATFFPSQAPLDTSTKYYDLRITISNSGNSFSVSAQPIAGTRMAGDWTFTLANTGKKERKSGGNTVTGWDI